MIRDLYSDKRVIDDDQDILLLIWDDDIVSFPQLGARSKKNANLNSLEQISHFGIALPLQAAHPASTVVTTTATTAAAGINPYSTSSPTTQIKIKVSVHWLLLPWPWVDFYFLKIGIVAPSADFALLSRVGI